MKNIKYLKINLLACMRTSCNAETASDPSKGSCELKKTDSSFVEDSHQPTSSNSNCRRSSSDISHEPSDCTKAQRECRLRPHFSDPMPTDAVKRKQLEMKIAAAARQHAQKRRQERDPSSVFPKANSNYTSNYDENHRVLSGSFRSKYRWSNVSSLSADSGIVGGNEERDNADISSGGTPRMRSAVMERADSGISQVLSRKWRSRASETLTSLQAWEAHQPCTDCGGRDFPLETDVQNQNKRRATLCEKCLKCRTERKESVLEFVNTEASYGEDLRIIKEEFYLPMQAAGLLTQEQLLVVFSNIQELIDLNENFLEYLQEEIEQAFEQGDDDLMTVCIGEIFLEFVNMLPAFQTYCLQQSSSVNMLNALEKEKELLRIFLNVSQNDNTALRRMNLRSFLMAPLQRVTKYPLLLSRIIKATIEYHPDHSSLREAKSRIESHLEHINMKTKQEGNSWTLRSFRQDSKKNREVINIEMRETAIKTVGWLREETRFVMEGPLQLAQPPDGQWVKKGSKTLKFQNMQVLLMVNIRRVSESSFEPGEPGLVKDAVLVLIRDKNNGKFSLLREPLRLSNCVVSVDPDCDDTFELLEIRRESFVFRDSDKTRTHHWFRQIRRYSRELGSWKKRRNALPNIMITASHNRS
ncbi:intersectin-2-like isoform X2 [Anolis sagrei]|uniref:intersectin-2-like isoform X2 n=1 Tax=Anolis sagrei TaxID=38937 RepID=UPI003521C0DF